MKLSSDGWKAITKDAIIAICANVDYKAHTESKSSYASSLISLHQQSYTLELEEVTAKDKDGAAQCQHFMAIIDRAEERYRCQVIYFTTDADGGSKKGCQLLQKARKWLIVPSCWAHQFQLILLDYFKAHSPASDTAASAMELIGWLNNHGKVRKIMDKSQADVSLDRTGVATVLAYLVANLTRWTTHYIAFARLFKVKEALQLAVLKYCGSIIKAQVGAAKGREKTELTESAERGCSLIGDPHFWISLETVLGDIEPITYGTNINQRDSTRPDQVLRL